MARRTPARVDWGGLAHRAEEARELAYAPYSRYRVGAALLAARPGEPPEVYVGGNIENASYPLCVCAERHAIAHAVFAGAREFLAMAVATEGPVAGSPCGACRQVMAEFARDLPVAMVVKGKCVKKTSLARLLPDAFRAADVGLGRPSAQKKPPK
ncbi:MAG: cytidine deaminase [Deltaproteobacteria bacterium]